VPAQSRVGDNSQVGADSHGCPACPHACIGPAVKGSPNVYVNDLPAVRYQDNGLHAACCGSNTWVAANGSDSVYINGLPAHREGDDDDHCGGKGKMVAGSPNVFSGGGKTTRTYDSKPPKPEDPVPHDKSYTVSLVDALGRKLASAVALVRCPHEEDRRITFTGETTVTGLCDGAYISLLHPFDEIWHRDAE